VGEYSLSSRGRYDSVTNREMVTVFTNVDHKRNSKGFQYIANRLRKIAKEHSTAKSPMLFNIANIQDFQQVMERDYLFDGATIDMKKSFVGLKDDKNFYYVMANQEFSFDALNKFIQDYKKGLIEGHEKVS
jgi:hypothetical protein